MDLWNKKIEDMKPKENIKHLYFDLIPAYIDELNKKQREELLKVILT